MPLPFQSLDSKIEDLRMYFYRLNMKQRKEFLNNLQKQSNDLKNHPKFRNFMNTCIREYNVEMRQHNAGVLRFCEEVRRKSWEAKTTSSLKPKAPAKSEILDKSYDKSQVLDEIPLRTENTVSFLNPVVSKVIGKWGIKRGPFDFYFTFNSNGTFETDEIPGEKLTRGTYTYDGANMILTSTNRGDTGSLFKVDVNGNNLKLVFPSGNSEYYTRIS